MATTIKPIEAKSVHQIQSGQVIVDLCSVVKELVENSLDAGATTVEVRFKNNGLDSIEVQDNGSGIAESNYENVALKHYTSKLSSYDDLSRLHTFGFRGEALSSLCALSTFTIITAQSHEAPKGKRLDFEVSGKLKSTTLVAAQTGTIAIVENLFQKLPVRRKELGKNIKREYGKVVTLLQAYACVSTGVKFIVKNSMVKGKSAVVFATQGNATTRENITNVYGAKTLSQLIELDLLFGVGSESKQTRLSTDPPTDVAVKGHISRPVFGEGRQTPDRQMFFVNGRPCGLPQITKAINEVYKSYNLSQSPFIFADFILDTNSYDVNVSPDKRSIYLHDAALLIESLKTSLTELFDRTEQTVPQSTRGTSKLPVMRSVISGNNEKATTAESPLTSLPQGDETAIEPELSTSYNDPVRGDSDSEEQSPTSLFRSHFQHITSTRKEEDREISHRSAEKLQDSKEKQAQKIAQALRRHGSRHMEINEDESEEDDRSSVQNVTEVHVRDFNARMKEQDMRSTPALAQAQHNLSEAQEQEYLRDIDPEEETVGVVGNAHNNVRRRRVSPDVATIKIGDRTVTRVVGSQKPASSLTNISQNKVHDRSANNSSTASQFSQKLRKFDAVKEQTLSDSDGVSTESKELDDDANSLRDTDKDPLHSPDGDIETSSDDEKASDLHTQLGPRTDTDSLSAANERADEEARVAELIRQAEAMTSDESKVKQKRSAYALKSSSKKDLTTDLVAVVDVDINSVKEEANRMAQIVVAGKQKPKKSNLKALDDNYAEEERLSLTVSKSDFALMRIVGQFNLGFIIAVRPQSAVASEDEPGSDRRDELFIIDQHASDEKYNFERLQAETIVGNQRLVRPVRLDLTAIEEEIILENGLALEKNGFEIDIDTSGNEPIGTRCKIISLPLSKEVVFNTQDLEELINLMAESPMLSESSFVPRPSKVRKMFAMRACRSSIMIGKTLSGRQMSSILQHMGEIDKPWNCPHGRPTMRHLRTLDVLDAELWKEGDGVRSEPDDAKAEESDIWRQYMSWTGQMEQEQ